MQSPIDAWMARQGVTRVELAPVLGLDPSAVSRKARGEREFTQPEVDICLRYFSERLGRPVTYEETFGAPAPTTEPAEAAR